MNRQISLKTMPQHDSPFWNQESKDLDYKEIARTFFGRKEKRIGQLTGVDRESVRYDSKIPKEVKEFLQFMASILHLVYEYFDHDFGKTKTWLKLPNPLIGGCITPKEMVHIGRHEKLLQIISSALQEEIP